MSLRLPRTAGAATAGAVIVASAIAGWAGASGPQWEPAAAIVQGLAAVVLFATGLVSPYAGLLVWFCVLPLFDAAMVGPAGVPLTAGHVALAGAVIGWAARRVRDGSAVPPGAVPLLAVLAAMPLAGAISIAASPVPAVSLGATARLALMWLIAVVVATEAQRVDRAAVMLAVLTAVGCLLTGVAAFQLVFPDLRIGTAAVQGLNAVDEIVRPAAFFRDPNFLAGYLSACAGVASALAIRARRAREAAPWTAGALVCIAGVVITSSRSGLVGLAAAAAFVVLSAPARRRTAALVALAVALAVAILVTPEGTWQRLAQLARPAQAGSLSTRYLMAVSDVRMFLDHAPAGVGIGAHDDVYPAYRIPGALPRITHPHQVPFSFVAETGIPGLLALIGTLVGVGIGVRRFACRSWPGISAAATAAVVVLAVESLFQYYLFFEHMWIALGLFAAAAAHERQDARAR